MNSDELKYYAREMSHKLRRKNLTNLKITIYVDRKSFLQTREYYRHTYGPDVDRNNDTIQVDRCMWVSWALNLTENDAPMIAMESGDFWDFLPDNYFRP
jgi:hypothetical protein